MPALASQISADSQRDDAQSVSGGQNALENPSALRRGARAVVRHIKNHVGVGIICSVAYFDPGNWSVDLQAGSQFGYRPLLFVVLLTGLGAIVLQSLACKLGCVTGVDLATHCRLALHDHPKYPRLVRYMVLYPLYVLCEIAIVCTDLAELLGSAIGLCLLIPSMPLWAAVLLTAADVLIFLLLGDPSRHKRPVRMFEFSIIALVFAVLACFIVLLVKVHPDWPSAFLGYIPSKKLFDTDENVLYTAVGILGATVMPHALFLGSFLATQDRVGSQDTSLPNPVQSADSAASPGFRTRFKDWFKSLFAVTRTERIAASRDYRMKYGRENNDIEFIRAHLKHGIVDIVTSLMGIAVPINSAILIVAAAVFFTNGTGSEVPAGLFDAHQLIVDHVGKAAGVIFALALLSAGQSSSITATLAGQVVSEGFIEWRVSPFLRRLITRCLGLIPSMVVAIAVGRPGINALLVASQVALSVVLPFVTLPLILLTSSKTIMRVKKPSVSEKAPQELPAIQHSDALDDDGQPSMTGVEADKTEVNQMEIVAQVASPEGEEYLDFSNGSVLTVVSGLIFLIVLSANIYVFVMLGSGKEQ